MLKEFNIQIKRSARRSISVMIRPDQSLVVSAPFYVLNSQIEAFLLEKKNWITRKLDELKSIPQNKPTAFANGAVFPFLGKNYTLVVIHTPSPYVAILDDQLVVSVKSGMDSAKQTGLVQKLLIQWYQEQALARAKVRANLYAGRLGVSPKSISIKKYRRRWGTCKSTGDIVINWLLALGPSEVFDYVVVHELSHLKQFNHSPRFWALVGAVFPNHKEVKKKLKFMNDRSLESFLGISN